MSDRLTFSWFVGTCNLGHPATGPQEALWNTVNNSDDDDIYSVLAKNFFYAIQIFYYL
jgi:hypothetical protein